MMTRKLSVLLLSLTLAALTARGDAVIEKTEVAGIINYSEYAGEQGFAGSKVGFGGATQPAAMDWLKQEGFGTVINLRLADEEGVDVETSRAAAEAAGLRYVHLPFDAGNPDQGQIDRFFSLLEDSSNQPVYVHCGSATRAGALWMIGRVQQDKLDLQAAGGEARAIALKPEAAVNFATGYLSRDTR
jgi:uncharacterized protein (TIGR01244 family)